LKGVNDVNPWQRVHAAEPWKGESVVFDAGRVSRNGAPT
jgi:hypothetical protein